MVKQGLYDPQFEHDSCGVGFVANTNGQRSHQIVTDGITILKNLVHRGALGGDSKTGDGAGILVQIPHAFFTKVCHASGIALPEEGTYGVGMFFLPREADRLVEAKNLVADICKREQADCLGWRTVPIDPACLGEMAAASRPHVSQLFLRMQGTSGDALERRLYVLRRCIEKAALEQAFAIDALYIASFSCKTIVYKGMFVAPQLEAFYPDLSDQDFTSALSLIHQRYSTNTFPSWALAQPFRWLAHNGEINTLRGNVNKMRAREKTLSSELFGAEVRKLLPIINSDLSDSGIVDNVFELLSLGGRSIEHAMMMMVPEAWGPKYHISQDKRAFYEYHAAIMEPWDGPAAMVFTDGTHVGAMLDRNGLRPARFVVTKSGRFVLASEVGVLDIQPEDVLQKGRLAPGKMLLVDTERGRIIFDHEIKSSVSRRKPYRRWLDANRIELRGLFQAPGPVIAASDSWPIWQKTFGYTLEDIHMIIAPMAENGQEPVGSMGNDAALAVLSERPQLLYNYFKQLFAQVTNPPIDPYRENQVMSLMSFIGREGNLLDETPMHCHQLKLPHPLLTNDDIEKLRRSDLHDFRVATVPALFGPDETGVSLQQAIAGLCDEVEKRVDEGFSIVILSDRGVDEKKAPVPALLAVASVHHHLVKTGKRHLTGLVLETGEAREVMHFALLSGYGASAINPYAVFEVIAQLKKSDRLPGDMKIETAIDNYITAIKKGLLKIMSKMGIATIRSYKSAQVFEAVGLNADLVGRYFPGTPSRIEGIGIDVIAAEARARHAAAFARCSSQVTGIDSGGAIHYRRFSEKHLYSPEAITLVQVGKFIG